MFKTKKTIYKIFCYILVLVILFSIKGCLDNLLWNDGYCNASSCGGQFELYDVEVSRGFQYYIYKCDTCGNVIETSSQK